MKRLMSILVMLLFIFTTSGMVPVYAMDQQEQQGDTAAYQAFMLSTGGKYQDDDTLDVTVLLDDEKMAKECDLSIPEAYRVDDKASLDKRIAFSKETQEAFLQLLEEKDIEVKVLNRYEATLNGFALKTTYENAKAIAQLDMVALVEVPGKYTYPEVQEEPQKMFPLDKGSNHMINAEKAWKKDYSGKGKLIAIIDTGANVEHEIFKEIDANHLKLKKNDPIFNKYTIAKGKYYSDKIPFAYNYVSNDQYVKENRNYAHGMHVAGIVGANTEKLKGVAPDAQLAILRVFGDASARTSGQIYNRAIEDAVKIGVDAINISIGEPSVAEKRMDASTYSALQSAQKAGVVVSIAAGNSGFAGFREIDGPSASHPDYGTLSTPAHMDLSLAVASVDNQTTPYKSIRLSKTNDPAKIVHYADSGIGQLADNFVDFVDVGYGRKEDYNGKSVKDKYVLIKRGSDNGQELRFDTKINTAEHHGAIGVVVYDNEENKELLPMDVGKTRIPSAFISKESGEYLLAHKDEQIRFDKDYNFMDSNEPVKISNFSSWGVTHEGNLKPDISAPGGNIYSSFNEGYGVMSGTSMAAPHVAGAIAMMSEYVDKDFSNVKENEKHRLIKNLLMSTAKPSKHQEKNAYMSPRAQGAGLMDLDAALSSMVVVTGDKGVSSVNVGNIQGNTVSFKAHLHNYGKTAKKYTYSAELNTDTVAGDTIQLLPTNLMHSDKKEVTVEAGKDAEVVISLQLSDDQIQNLSQQMENGFFLEGYVIFDDVDATNPVNLSLPFVSFHGDFSNLPVLEDSVYSLHGKGKKSHYDGKKTAAFFPFTHLQTSDYGVKKVIGEVKKAEGSGYLSDAVAISPNGDQRGDYARFCGVFTRNYRDIEAAVYRADDATQSQPVWTSRKGNSMNGKKNAVYNGMNITRLVEEALLNEWYGRDNANRELPEGNYVMVVKVKPDNNEDNIKAQKMEIPIKIDLTPPEISRNTYDSETGDFHMTEFEDASGVRHAEISYKGKTYPADANNHIKLDKDVDVSQAKLILYDHAFNKKEMPLNQAILGGDEYQVKIKASSPLGEIPVTDVKWTLTNKENGQQVNPKKCAPGAYELSIDSYNEKYQLVGDAKRDITVKDGEKNTVVDLKFSLKAKKEVYFSINADDEDLKAKTKFIVTDQFTQEKHNVTEKIIGKYHISLPISRYKVEVKTPEEHRFTFDNLDDSQGFFDGKLLDLTKAQKEVVELSGTLKQDEEPAPEPEPSTHLVKITAIPKDATIVVKKVDSDTIMDKEEEGYRLETGKYQVEVTKEGYISKTQEIEVKNDMSLSIELEKETPVPQPQDIYLLKITTEPQDAVVVVKKVGTSEPLTPEGKDYKLEKGKYQVEVKRSGYKSKTETVTLTEDTTIEISLAKLPKSIGGGGGGGSIPTPIEPSKPSLPAPIDKQKEIKGTEQKGYIGGYPDDTFRPNREMTRAEVAAMLAELLPETKATTQARFSDVRDGQWHANAIYKLVAMDVIHGYSDGSFRPEAKITRAEYTSMIANYKKAQSQHTAFNDIKGHWAESAINAAKENRWIGGYPDGSFKPQNHLTRAEAVSMTNRVFSMPLKADISKKISNKEKPFNDIAINDWFYEDIWKAKKAV